MILFKNKKQAIELRKKAYKMLQKKKEYIIDVEKWENAFIESNDYIKKINLEEIDRKLGIIK